MNCQPETMKNEITRTARRAIREALKGKTKFISIGRSHNSAGFGSRTPIEVIDGNQSPELKGEPYLKTQFSNGRGFSKTLYTPSTLHVTVGREWIAGK